MVKKALVSVPISLVSICVRALLLLGTWAAHEAAHEAVRSFTPFAFVSESSVQSKISDFATEDLFDTPPSRQAANSQGEKREDMLLDNLTITYHAAAIIEIFFGADL